MEDVKKLSIEERRQQSKEWWDRSRALFAAHADIWESYRVLVSRLFAARLADREGKEVSRRPPWSLRLFAAGDPPAHLVARPCFRRPSLWKGTPGGILVDEVAIELMVARVRNTDGIAFAYGWELKGCLKPGSATHNGGNLQFGEEAIERAVATASAFVADPAMTMARAADNCCLCGRVLTDEQSRSRGVGPECVRFLNSLVGNYSDRKMRGLFSTWQAEAAAT